MSSGISPMRMVVVAVSFAAFTALAAEDAAESIAPTAPSWSANARLEAPASLARGAARRDEARGSCARGVSRRRRAVVAELDREALRQRREVNRALAAEMLRDQPSAAD